ncbi:MAG: hypothetical protein HFI76_04860 [Lachnospiraceae bacterium]|nr:hypothetical protein [Lachnospiraceae bacterium]
MKKMELSQENDILPQLRNIEACYTSTYKRYQTGIEQMESIQGDIDIMKSVIREHGEKLQMIS